MKKKFSFVILLCLILCSYGSKAQQNSIIGNSYTTNVPLTKFLKYDLISEKTLDTSVLVGNYTQFTITKIINDGYVIVFWNFTSDTQLLKKVKSFDKSKPEFKTNSDDYLTKFNAATYYISVKDLNDCCIPYFPKITHRFTWGFLTIPIKCRFKNSNSPFQFEEKVNVGITAGFKFQRPSSVLSVHNLLGSIGVSSVKLSDTSSAAALTFTAGYMYQFSTFQIGVFTGIDIVSGAQGKNWSFQNKPWIGFALGISLFGENHTSSTSSQEQK